MPFKDPAKTKAYRVEYRLRNREKINDWFRKYRKTHRGMTITRRSAKKWRNSEKGQETLRKHYMTTEYRQRIKANVKRYQQSEKGKKNRKLIEEKRKCCKDPALLAKRAINQRVRRGLMQKISYLHCLKCGKKAEHRHHYHGYAKKYWFDVIPLCIPCHRKAHSPGLHDFGVIPY